MWYHIYTFFSTVLTAEYDRVLMFKEPVSDKALEGHVIRTEIVPDYGSCRVKCYLDPNCKSINVGPFDERTQICELNDDSDESPSHLGLVERQRYTYHAVEVWSAGVEFVSLDMISGYLFMHEPKLCRLEASVVGKRQQRAYTISWTAKRKMVSETTTATTTTT